MTRKKTTTRNYAQLAVDSLGSQGELARRLGIRRQAVQQWVAKGRIPLSRVPSVSQATGLPKRMLDPAFQ